MKIIRHSHKLTVYSLSLLLYAQQLSCMQQQQLSVDTSRQGALMAQIRALNTTNARIDMMQTMLGSVIKNTELGGTNVAPAQLENVPLDDITINNANQEQTQQNLITMHKQILKYKAKLLYSLEESRKTQENERKANALSAAVGGFILGKQCFKPNLTVITGGGHHQLPENPRNLDANDLINALKLSLGSVPDNATFLSKTARAYKDDLETKHTFFLEREAACCPATPAQQEEALKYKIELRAIAIPLTCFAQKQTILAQLKAAAAANQPANTLSSAPPASHSNGQTLYGTMQPQGQPPAYTDKPHPLSQVADPFIPGSGVGNIQYKPLEADQNK